MRFRLTHATHAGAFMAGLWFARHALYVFAVGVLLGVLFVYSSRTLRSIARAAAAKTAELHALTVERLRAQVDESRARTEHRVRTVVGAAQGGGPCPSDRLRGRRALAMMLAKETLERAHGAQNAVANVVQSLTELYEIARESDDGKRLEVLGDCLQDARTIESRVEGLYA